jgi:ABC-type lipoprotein release transport system permease subunit
VLAGVILLAFLRGAAILIVSGILIAVIAVWINYALPYIMRFVSFLLAKLRGTGSVGLSAKTVKKNRALHTVTVLLAVILSFFFIVGEILNMVKTAATPYRSRFQADYAVTGFSTLTPLEHDLVLNAIRGVDGIARAGYFNEGRFLFPDSKTDLSSDSFAVNGAADADVLRQMASGGLDKDALIHWERHDHPIIFSEDMMTQYGWSVFDIVKLVPYDAAFRGEDFSFVIVGIDYTQTEYDKIGFAKYDDIYRLDRTATYLAVAESPPKDPKNDRVFLDLRQTVETFELNGKPLEKTYALTYAEWAFGARANLQGIFGLLTFLQVVLFVICFLGIANIMVVTAMDRRHEFLLYRLSGMSQADTVRFSLGEALSVGTAGGFLGIFLSFIINRLLPAAGTLVNKYYNYGYFPLSALPIAAAGISAFAALWLLISFFRRNVKLASINERLQ